MLQSKPDALLIGLPPEFHGSTNDPQANIELECAEVRALLSQLKQAAASSVLKHSSRQAS